MNQWNIPEWLEHEVRERDKVCVYCGIEMIEKVPRGCSRKNAATWEHIINDQTIITKENIARCCSSCNASKGTKQLSDWIDSSYSKRKGIDRNTVAHVVKAALKKGL